MKQIKSISPSQLSGFERAVKQHCELAWLGGFSIGLRLTLMQRTRRSASPFCSTKKAYLKTCPATTRQASLRAAEEHTNSIIPDPGNPIDFDRYAYVRNNPLKYVDPNGHDPSIVPDLLFITYDVYQINQEGWTLVNTVALVADIACAIVPIGTGGGPAVRAAMAGEDAVLAFTQAASQIPDAIRAGQAVEKFDQAIDGQSDGSNISFSSSDPNSGGWQVGDPINSPTSNGYPSWSTVQRRYWMNRANNARPGEFSAENLARMKNGDPPIHPELGVSMELHHINGRRIVDPHNINNLRETWPWEHSDIDPFRHYKGKRPK